ncbi:hypothetical protein AXA84_0273 [Candidatus Phytoplasma oryzae]|uniref:Uncharacterized protein n=1 Tax=Candidatus Phytoplasma oryzae TaxID=203274 RepID=A0A139JQE7_9MOLU|nr:YitT family protein [Candidatus Phytoplasma oryzae]KXT29185.1 hypothetical protein AXA84_0287 [Candidatus Phytoplasma oryzae]KXT29201.1 hypothetical protein AXA84_0273 [Candidatus Phytoplasma oryzae]RAM57740.1 hypothetical protein DH96_01385 [Candidatus Phytoplasma oryzae]
MIFSKNKEIKKWFFLIINDIILALSIYFFTLGIKLNTGGMDGLSICTVQFMKLFNFQIFNYLREDFIISFFISCYTFLSLIIGYKFFGKDFLLKTVFLCLILNITIPFLSYFLGESKNNILSTNILNKNFFIKMIFYSFLSGVFIGLSLSNIMKIGYTTGGMDIFQKILKEKYKLNFIIIFFITDGCIIFLSSFLESIIQAENNMHFHYLIILKNLIIRIICSFLSLFLIGYIMEKNFSSFFNKKKNNFLHFKN